MFGGRNQKPSDPPLADEGIFVLGKRLYAEDGYDVHMYKYSDVVPAFNEVASAVNSRCVTQVSILGYSWGAGATYELASWLTWDSERTHRQIIRAYTIAFTAYIDAIAWRSAFPPTAQTERPPSSQFNVNFYQPTGLAHGEPTKLTAGHVDDVNVNVNRDWGLSLTHNTIEDDVAGAGRRVLDEIRRLFLVTRKVPR